MEESSEHTVSKSSDEEVSTATRVVMNLGEYPFKYPSSKTRDSHFLPSISDMLRLHFPSFSHKFGNGNLIIPLFSLGLITQKKKTWQLDHGHGTFTDVTSTV